MIGYHATPAENKESILREGLRLGVKSKLPTEGRVFFAERISMALWWARELRTYCGKNATQWSLFGVNLAGLAFRIGPSRWFELYVEVPIPPDRVMWLEDFSVERHGTKE